MFKVLTVFGTRPETIKLAPVIKELNKYKDKIKSYVCVTAQHREMMDPFLKLFDIHPDYDLNMMKSGQSLDYITQQGLCLLGEVMDKVKPDYLLVQGDTTTSMAASMAAFYRKIKVGHIEAGLRTGNKWSPYPEEVNRRIIDQVSDLYFAHTTSAKENLLREGVPSDKIEVTGNTVIDSLLEMADRDFSVHGTPLERIPFDIKKIILVTVHRRESFGEPLDNIYSALLQIAQRYHDRYQIVYPVHLNPNVKNKAYAMLAGTEGISLIEPLDYLAFVQLMKRSYLILTDSGGIQEEAPGLSKPVLVLRDVTERPEGVSCGAIEVVGTQTGDIVENTVRLLNNGSAYKQMANAKNPYGDGKASSRIVGRLLKEA